VAEALVEAAGALADDVASHAHASELLLARPRLRGRDELRADPAAALRLVDDQRAELGVRVALEAQHHADVNESDDAIAVDRHEDRVIVAREDRSERASAFRIAELPGEIPDVIAGFRAPDHSFSSQNCPTRSCPKLRCFSWRTSLNPLRM